MLFNRSIVATILTIWCLFGWIASVTDASDAPATKPASLPTTRSSQNPVLRAARNHWVAELSRLLDEGADVNVRSLSYGETALYYAAQNGDSDVVKLLLAHGADPNVAAVCLRTPLMVAKTAEVASMLLESKANIDARDNISNWTALSFAVNRGRLGVVAVLLEHGAVTDDGVDERGLSLIRFAPERDQSRIFELLRANGVKESPKSKSKAE